MALPSNLLFVPVVIVGAGPTGVTAAILLAQYGVQCLVLDRWDDVYPQPRAVHLDDEVYRILDRLGVSEAFAAISRPARGLRLLDKRLNVLAEFQRDSAPSNQGFPQANMFDQPELESILRERMNRHPLVAFRGNVEVTDIQPAESGPTRVLFADRNTGTTHAVSAHFVLGCDGANSLVRSAIGAEMEDLGFEQRWLVIDVDTDADLGHWEGVHQVCDSTRAATYMRIGVTRHRWEFQLLDGEAVADFDTIERLMPLIAPWVADTAVDHLQLVRVTEYTFRAQLATQWRKGNAFILGDAAHLTPPFIGQGMGAGVRDAMNLTWKIAGALAGTLSPAVLDSYQQERKPHARSLIRLAVGIGWAMTGGGSIGDVVRRTVVPRLRLIPGLRARIAASRTPPLRRSGFVVKGHTRGRLAGTLSPNAVVGTQVRLNDLTGNRFALVTRAPVSTQDHTVLNRRGAVVVQAHPGSELERWLRRGHAAGAIVRPDMTVMSAGGSVSALCKRMPTFTPPLLPNHPAETAKPEGSR
ncbi:bifunctional 3-(3-hydroxy-phenyl)propionate/3-hydroxycinnamic acid hydroxylase [Mycobacterium sp. Y57]|uniref:bifunctional 3-(3-hydroxy-phenyl)propionate/3-hydroxycinnamic acid hydroxylase MhpA n=1 Tax=Mycolicibacterium xanthum TaxID=2796469 RepID=UPI001C84EB97|nr:bifunctional 3-(3-hydroxy-phenyl)propionate/3-hydroxycinnamic acid hydroxylase [Mycolicibacterium xanthum]MBX7435133.1 bifunctional 3-(3-hydroxy-phenyl)propionate/3-hydroxycinnamic acid hydroxylase [Mycolicibacterium xanthum]